MYTPIFLSVTIIGLIIACFNNTQVGEIGPAAQVSSNFQDVLYLDKQSLFAKSRIKDYFLRGRSTVKETDQPLSMELLQSELRNWPAMSAVAVLTSNLMTYDELQTLAGASVENLNCGSIQTASSIVDSTLFRMNPKHNQRRRPTWFVVCRRV